MSVDFWVKLRDAGQMIADAANEQLERMVPRHLKFDEKDWDKLVWEDCEGAKGHFNGSVRRRIITAISLKRCRAFSESVVASVKSVPTSIGLTTKIQMLLTGVENNE